MRNYANFQNHIYYSKLKLNCATIVDSCGGVCDILDFNNDSYLSTINGDVSFCVLYNFDLDKCKYINYKYINYIK